MKRFAPLLFIMVIALCALAIPLVHGSTLPAATSGTTKATLPDGAVIWCWGSPGAVYAPIANFPYDTDPDPNNNTTGVNPGNLPAEWQGNGILYNPEPATSSNAANINDLGQDALTYVSTVAGADINDVYAIQINYWNSVVTGDKPGVPEYPSGTTTPGAIGYSAGNSCMLYYPGPNNPTGINQGEFEITYPAAPSQPNPNETALQNSDPALWKAFPMNENSPFASSIAQGGPTGYVSTWKGCSWDANSCTTGSQVVPVGGTAPIFSDWNVFPEVLANVTSIPTSWTIGYDKNYGDPNTLDYPVGSNLQHPVWDASYDIWFDKNGVTGTGQAPYGNARGQNDGLEIMVWLNSKNSYVDTVVGGVGVPGNNTTNPVYPVPNITGYAQPSGTRREQVWINGVVYDVWTARLNNPYYGYATALNPNKGSQPDYTVVAGGAEPFTCPTLSLYNPNSSGATTASNVNGPGYTCGTEWNVVSFVATQSNNSGTNVDYRGPTMSMDTKVFTDYIMGINDGLWQQVTPPFTTFAGNRAGATSSSIGVLQCPGSAMSAQLDNPVDAPSACLQQNWLLTSVQAGFEPWEGGNGLESQSFSAHVITQQTAIQSGLTTNQGNTPNEPVVNWNNNFQIVFPGCQSGTNPITYSAPTGPVTYVITGYPNGDTTQPVLTKSGTLSQIPGTLQYGATGPQLAPIHNTATITYTAACSGGTQTSLVEFWVDPSGQVFYSDGVTPAPGATVTLLYSPSESANGPFEAVPNNNFGLTPPLTMDPDDNTLNPTVTAKYGVYAWDVLPGYYEVTATKSGCGTVTSPVQHVTTTPITNLYLDLPCAPPPLPNLVAPSIPSAPTGLIAFAVSSSQIDLIWNPVPLPLNADSVTYTIYEYYPGTALVTVVASGLTGTSYQVTGLRPGNTYTYAVAAVDASGEAQSATVTATTLPAPSNCHVTYTVTSSVPGVNNGLTANINIQNTGSTAIYPWTLGWTFPGNQKVSYAWNVNESQNGQTVSMSSTAPWESIPAGATLTGAVGFNGSYTGTNANPTAFTLNGVPCD
ncbi:MAG: cellulose binding domain-containing protein [Terracidiphilus sp.]